MTPLLLTVMVVMATLYPDAIFHGGIEAFLVCDCSLAWHGTGCSCGR